MSLSEKIDLSCLLENTSSSQTRTETATPIPPATKTCRRIKILTLGEPRVGKTTLLKRYSEKRFESRYFPTIGVDFGVKRIHDSLELHFWDLAGGSEYLPVRDEFYGNADCVLLLYDCTDRKTFAALPKWIIEADNHGTNSDNTVFYLCGNKNDRYCVSSSKDEHQQKQMEVSLEKAERFAALHNMKHFSISSKTGNSVNDLFQALLDTITTS